MDLGSWWQRRSAPGRPGACVWGSHRGPLLQGVQCEPDRCLQLGVPPRGPVVGRHDDLDVGGDAVVSYPPAVLLEPEGQSRYGDLRSVDQLILMVVADDAAPGPGADDGAEPEQAEGGGDDVAVGCRAFVGEGDDWPPRRVLWIGSRDEAAPPVPGEHLAGQLLHHEFR